MLLLVSKVQRWVVIGLLALGLVLAAVVVFTPSLRCEVTGGNWLSGDSPTSGPWGYCVGR